MDPFDLALYTTAELIEELLRRTTFLGVVVHAEQEQRVAGWQGDKTFQVRFNANLSPAQAGRLLNVVADGIDSNQR